MQTKKAPPQALHRHSVRPSQQIPCRQTNGHGWIEPIVAERARRQRRHAVGRRIFHITRR